MPIVAFLRLWLEKSEALRLLVFCDRVAAAAHGFQCYQDRK